MKTTSVLCECGSKMLRVRAQSGSEDVRIGYYCPSCKALQNSKREYLVPVDLITRMDPFFLTVPKREAYLAILKTEELPIPRVIPGKTMDSARDVVKTEFKQFCRPAGNHEPARLDRGKFDQESQIELDNQVRSQEMREAAANQPKPTSN